MRVAIPPGTKGRQLAVTLTNTRLGVALKGAKTPGEVSAQRPCWHVCLLGPGSTFPRSFPRSFLPYLQVGGGLAVPGGVLLSGKISAEDCLWEIEDDAAAGTAWAVFTLILVRRMGAPFWTSLSKPEDGGGGSGAAAGGASAAASATSDS